MDQAKVQNRSHAFFGSFIPAVKKGFIELRLSYQQLTLRVLLLDLFSVARSIGFVIIPAFLVGGIFLLLPQGRDTLLLVVERLVKGDFWHLLFLLFGLSAWSICSELSVRYAIYISDNSGKSLSDERVDYRKRVQKLLAAAFLLWPCSIVMAGFIWALCEASFMDPGPQVLGFGFCILLVYWFGVATFEWTNS